MASDLVPNNDATHCREQYIITLRLISKNGVYLYCLRPERDSNARPTA